MQIAQGTFEVVIEPREELKEAGLTLGRMGLMKTFAGDLVGRAKGQMLTALTPVQGSAVYVAIEYVEGTLAGRTGGFALSHRGVMDKGRQDLTVAIVPDSGTGELAGIRGEMVISIGEGGHAYELTYVLLEELAE